jgi:hypothetical protein
MQAGKAPCQVNKPTLEVCASVRLRAGQLADGPRTRTHREALLPVTFMPVPGSDFMINLGWPFAAVRGWIEQQIVELDAASACHEDVVLLFAILRRAEPRRQPAWQRSTTGEMEGNLIQWQCLKTSVDAHRRTGLAGSRWSLVRPVW